MTDEQKILTPDTGTQQSPKPEPQPTSTGEEGLVDAQVTVLSEDRKVDPGPEVSFDEGLILQAPDGSFVVSFPLDRAEKAGDGHRVLNHLKYLADTRWRGAHKGNSPCRLRLVISCPEHGVHGTWEVNLGFAPETT